MLVFSPFVTFLFVLSIGDENPIPTPIGGTEEKLLEGALLIEWLVNDDMLSIKVSVKSLVCKIHKRQLNASPVQTP